MSDQQDLLGRSVEPAKLRRKGSRVSSASNTTPLESRR